MQNILALGLHIQPLFYHKQNAQPSPLRERDMPEVTSQLLEINKTEKKKKSSKRGIHLRLWHFQYYFPVNWWDLFASGRTELLPTHTVSHMDIHHRKVINDQHAACLKSHQKESGSPNTRNPLWACPVKLKIWLHSKGGLKEDNLRAKTKPDATLLKNYMIHLAFHLLYCGKVCPNWGETVSKKKL